MSCMISFSDVNIKLLNVFSENFYNFITMVCRKILTINI